MANNETGCAIAHSALLFLMYLTQAAISAMGAILVRIPATAPSQSPSTLACFSATKQNLHHNYCDLTGMESPRRDPTSRELGRTRYDSGWSPTMSASIVDLRPSAVALAASTYRLALSMVMASRDAVSTVSRDPVAIIATIDGFFHALTSASPWEVSHAVLILYGVYSLLVHLCLFVLNVFARIFCAWVSLNRTLPHLLQECLVSLLRLATTLPPLLLDGFTLFFVIAAFGSMGVLHGIPIVRKLMHRVKTLVWGKKTTHNVFPPSHTKNGHLVKPPLGATYVTVSHKARRYSSSVPQKRVSFSDDRVHDNMTNIGLAPGKSANGNGDHRPVLALQAREIQRLQESLSDALHRNREFKGSGAEMEECRRDLTTEQARCRLLQAQLHQLRTEMRAEGHPLERSYPESQEQIQALLLKQSQAKQERHEMEKSSLGFIDKITQLEKQLKGIDKVHQCQMDKLRRRLIAAEAKSATTEKEAAQYRRHRHFFVDIDHYDGNGELKSAETETC